MREITNNGLRVMEHPTLGILVRADGAVCMRIGNSNKRHWTYGYKNPVTGYCTVLLHKHTCAVHRLVAEAFIPNPYNKPTVDHIDRTRDNNWVGNLRWATHKEQNENCSTVFNRVDYGVRKCDDIKAYRRAYRQAHQEYFREWEKAHKGRKHGRG